VSSGLKTKSSELRVLGLKKSDRRRDTRVGQERERKNGQEANEATMIHKRTKVEVSGRLEKIEEAKRKVKNVPGRDESDKLHRRKKSQRKL
jgi:hypothetical protein